MTRLKTLKNISTGTAAAVLLTVVGSTASVGAIQNSQHSMNTASSSSMHMQDSSMQMHMQDQNHMKMMWADSMMNHMHMAHSEFMQQMESHMSNWDQSKRAGLDTKIHEIMTEHRMNMDRAMAEYKMHIAQGMNHDEAHNRFMNHYNMHKAHAMNQMHEAHNHWIDWANNHSNGTVSAEEKDHFINKFNHTMDWYNNKMEHIKNNQ